MTKEQPAAENWLLNRRQETVLGLDKKKFQLMYAVNKLMPLGYRLAYEGGRWVDNVVDGDEPLPPGFSSVDTWLDGLLFPTNDQTSAAFLFQQATEYLKPLENKALGDDVSREFTLFIESMRQEYERREHPQILSNTEILDRHWQTFCHAQNITLISLQSKERLPHQRPSLDYLLGADPNEMPLPLPLILGKKYSVRDLKTDLDKHIFNFDQWTCAASCLSPEEIMYQPDKVMNNSVIQKWGKEELNLSRRLALKANQKRLDLPTGALVTFLTADIVFRRV
jgi:hypothetical protein